MKQTKMKIFLLSFLILTTGASAARASSDVELMGASLGGVVLQSSEGSNTETSIALSLGLGYFLTPMIEGFFEGSYAHYSAGGSNSSHSLQWIVGPRFNFGDAPVSAFYAGFGVGEGQPTGLTLHTFSWQVHAGKRFELFPNVSWSPQIEYTHVNGDSGSYSTRESHAVWAVVPFRFSIVL